MCVCVWGVGGGVTIDGTRLKLTVLGQFRSRFTVIAAGKNVIGQKMLGPFALTFKLQADL